MPGTRGAEKQAAGWVTAGCFVVRPVNSVCLAGSAQEKRFEGAGLVREREGSALNRGSARWQAETSLTLPYRSMLKRLPLGMMPRSRRRCRPMSS